ncbi:MAG: hypothetical protein WDM91_19005 [Rhizomicrobium sp.]
MRKAPAPPAKIGQANDQNRALSLLTVVGLKRLGASFYVQKLLDRINAELQGEGGIKRARFDNFLAGGANLPDAAFHVLRRIVVDEITAQQGDHTIMGDLRLMRALLAELGLDRRHFTVEDDQVHLDRDFFRAMNMKIEDQKPVSLLERIGGYWFLVRYSTDESPGTGPSVYNVSLLMVQELRYMRLSEEVDEAVHTAIPHFSLRSRSGEAGSGSRNQTYRGRVVETANAINFIGNRVDASKVLTMTWWLPSPAHERTKRAKEAYGVITTGSADDFSIAGPVGGCAVPEAKDITALKASLSEDQRARSEQLSMLYGDQYRGLSGLIGKHPEDRLFDKLGPVCGRDTVEKIVAELRRARESAAKGEMGGYYRARNVE